MTDLKMPPRRLFIGTTPVCLHHHQYCLQHKTIVISCIQAKGESNFPCLNLCDLTINVLLLNDRVEARNPYFRQHPFFRNHPEVKKR